MKGFDAKNDAIPDEIIKLWQRIVDSVAIFLSVPGVMINRLEPPDLEVFRSNNSPVNPLPSGTRMPMDGLYCTDVALRRHSLSVTDAAHDGQWSDSPTAKAGIIAYNGVPLLWPDGEVFGTLCAVDTGKNEWEDKAAVLLGTLREIIESHLALVMTREDLAFRADELEQALVEVLTLHGFREIL